MIPPSLEWRDAGEYFETTPPPIPWIVEGFVARGAVTLFAGDPGIGKSYVALSMASSASCGLPALGMNTRISEVAYLDAENGQDEMHRRICALGLRANARVAIAPSGFDIRQSLYQVEDAVAPATTQLLILDSFRSLFPGVDENDSGEITEALLPIQHLARTFNVGVILLHHRNKGGGIRGSMAFQGVCEAVVHLAADRDGVLTIAWEKQRMGGKPKRKRLMLTASGAVEL